MHRSGNVSSLEPACQPGQGSNSANGRSTHVTSSDWEAGLVGDVGATVGQVKGRDWHASAQQTAQFNEQKY
jgi:hypothetical protein